MKGLERLGLTEIGSLIFELKIKGVRQYGKEVEPPAPASSVEVILGKTPDELYKEKFIMNAVFENSCK